MEFRRTVAIGIKRLASFGGEVSIGGATEAQEQWANMVGKYLRVAIEIVVMLTIEIGDFTERMISRPLQFIIRTNDSYQ